MSKNIGERIAEALVAYNTEIAKFNAGNKSAGVRARKALMEIKNAASEGRKLISGGAGEEEGNASEEQVQAGEPQAQSGVA